MIHAIERIINAPAIFGWNKIRKVIPTVIRNGFLDLLGYYFRHEKTSLNKKSKKICQFRRLELNAKQRDPTLCAIDSDTEYPYSY